MQEQEVRSPEDYIVLARQKTGIYSDNKLADKIGCHSSALYRMRQEKSYLNEKHMVKLSELAGIPRREGLVELAIWRTGGTDLAPIYMKILNQITAIIAVFAFLGTPTAHACGATIASGSSVITNLFIVFTIYIMRQFCKNTCIRLYCFFRNIKLHQSVTDRAYSSMLCPC